MKHWPINLAIFTLCLIVGSAAFWLIVGFKSEAPADEEPTEIIQAMPDQDKDYPREFTFSSISAEDGTDTTFFEFVENGKVTLDDCYSDYVVGDEPLALIKRGKKYSLEQVKLEHKKHIKSDLGNYITAKFKDSKNALIVVNGSKNLKRGPVQTAYVKPESSDKDDEVFESILMRDGFRQEVKLGDRIWTIRIARGINTSDGKKRPMNVLVVESEGQKQAIWYRIFLDGINDNAGWLEWLGDMDGDGLLDIQQSFYERNGGTQTSILYLSSKAKGDEFVRPYAFYSNRIKGCER